MIKQLKRKLTLINFSALALVILAVCLGVFLTNRAHIERVSDEALRRVLASDGTPSFPGGGVGGVQLPYFTVRLFADGSIQLADANYIRFSSAEEAEEMIADALERGTEDGYLREYGIRFRRMSTPFYEKIAFVDTSLEQNTLRHLMRTLLLAGLGALILLTALSACLAGLAIRPVEENVLRQKRFISDASHELKTPLTVILSAAALLREDLPQEGDLSRFAADIEAEGQRMKELTEQLLTLSRAEDASRPGERRPLDFSDLVTDELLLFEPLAFENGRPLRDSLAGGVRVCGDGEDLRRAVDVLLDNAVKYAAEHTEIAVTLTKSGDRAVLTVRNEAPPLTEEQRRNLFERFYRADASREGTRGFGLGLSIARAVAERHGGTLSFSQTNGTVAFSLTLPALP